MRAAKTIILYKNPTLHKRGFDLSVMQTKLPFSRTEEIIMYLSEVKNGVVATVKHIDSGCEMYRRILELGILPGAKLKILQNIPHGPVVFEKNGSKMLLGRGMAQKIRVED